MCEHVPDKSTAQPPATAGHATTNTILQQVIPRTKS